MYITFFSIHDLGTVHTIKVFISAAKRRQGLLKCDHLITASDLVRRSQ